MSLTQIILAVFLCGFCFKTSLSCSIDGNYYNVMTCASINDIEKVENISNWVQLAIRNINKIPKQKLKNDAFKNFPNLKKLFIDGIVNEFEDFPFRGLDKLETLILENNEIKELPEQNIFIGLPLIHLEIKHSKLNAIPPNYFRHLKNLKQLHFTKNGLSSVGDCAFCDLNNTVIGLSSNGLPSFDPIKVLGATSLIAGIELDGNNLTELPRFGQMINLREAKISDNHITKVSNDAFFNSPKLVSLLLSYNSIDDIPVSSLPETIRNDERFVLEINNNHFECLSEEFRNKFTALGRITIDSNPWKCKCLEDLKSWALELNATVNCDLSSTCIVRCINSENESKTMFM